MSPADDDGDINNDNSNNNSSDADCVEDSLTSLLNDTSLNSTGLDPGGGGVDPAGASVLFDIPPKEIVIVVAMLGLWIYSIIITRRAWYRILKQ